MKVKVTEDNCFLQIIDAKEEEITQLHYSFRKRIENWRFHPLVKKKIWDGYINFIDKFNRMPVGLWGKLIEFCKKYNFKLEFEGKEQLQNIEFNYKEFEKWVWEFFKDTEFGKGKPKEIRDYQIKAAAKTLKYYKSRSELATSAGKTLIMFIITCYLIEKNWAKKHLIIVPNISLVLQTYEAFKDYLQGTPLEGKLKLQQIGGGNSKEKTDADIVIGTYQTLKKLNSNFFEGIDCVCVDEAHHTKAKSIKDIITKVFTSKYRYGLSGTMQKGDTADAFTLDAYLGPIVNTVNAKFLINNEYATPVVIKSIELDYLDDEIKEKLYNLRLRKGRDIEATKILDIERKLVIENRKRFLYICNLLAKTTKNTLVLFNDIKFGYGKKFYNYLRENCEGKVIFYADGHTSTENREEYKKEMETGNNKILIASFGTFSTGISINNIHNIFFVESYKSERLIRQAIGRGMRLQKNKEKVVIWDFVDDFRYLPDDKNYLFNHGLERRNTYKKENFLYKIYKVKLA